MSSLNEEKGGSAEGHHGSRAQERRAGEELVLAVVAVALSKDRQSFA